MVAKLRVFIFQKLAIDAIAGAEVMTQLREKFTDMTGYKFQIIIDNHNIIGTSIRNR